MAGFVVADPARVEMPMVAAGLARAGLLRVLIAPFGAPRGSPGPSALRFVPRRLRGRVVAELRRRELPEALSPSQVEHVASVADALAAASKRNPLTELASPLLTRIREALFDRGVSRRLDPQDDGVVTVSGAAEYTLIRARTLGITSFLECPIAHHRAAERLLLEESRLQPDYAATLQFHRLPESYQRRLDTEIELADKLLVLSSYQEQTFIDEGVDPGKLIRIPLGVDTRLFQPHLRREDSTFRVLFVGQITQRKGLSYLIEAFERACIPQSELVLLGNIVGTDAPWRDRPRIRHVPHALPWDLPDHYATSDVYVLPSLVEGFPLTAAEAMASGLPVILSEHTFSHDVITDGADGYIVPIRDSDAIADRLLALYNDAAHRQAMGASARRTAEQFSWERYGERVVERLTETASRVSRQNDELDRGIDIGAARA